MQPYYCGVILTPHFVVQYGLQMQVHLAHPALQLLMRDPDTPCCCAVPPRDFRIQASIPDTGAQLLRGIDAQSQGKWPDCFVLGRLHD